MKPESEKFNKVLNLLRKSEPILDSTESIEREVIKRISAKNRSGLFFSEVIDFLFSWVYIGWVRRSFITASVFLILVFVYQQGVILKRIDVLSRQTIISNKENILSPADRLEKLLTAYKNSGRLFPSKSISMSEKQIKELLDQLYELQIKYKDLDKLIEEDPDLKKLIEKKLNEYDHTKINL